MADRAVVKGDMCWTLNVSIIPLLAQPIAFYLCWELWKAFAFFISITMMQFH